jgi:hypothetical protein
MVQCKIHGGEKKRDGEFRRNEEVNKMARRVLE